MSLTNPQVEALLAPLHPGRVRQVQGNAHLEAWDIRRHLTRVFGFTGWEDELLSLDCVSERSKWDEQNPLKGRHTVVYRCTMRLIVKDPDGVPLAKWDDGATGDAANQPSLGDAHDMAMKTAMSQALKRCAVNLGDQFGLGLYNNGRTEAVIGRSLPHEAATSAPVVDDVHGGEMTHEPDEELNDLKRQVWQAAQAKGFTSPTDLAEFYASWSGGLVLAEAAANDLAGFLTHLRADAAAA